MFRYILGRHPRGSMWPLPGRSRMLSRCFQESIDRGITRYRMLHIQFMSLCGARPRRLAPAPFKGFDRQVHHDPFPSLLCPFQIPTENLPTLPFRPLPPISLHRIPHPLFRLLIVHISASSFRNLSQWFFLPREKLLMSMLFLP